jgi:hypothetical protein
MFSDAPSLDRATQSPRHSSMHQEFDSTQRDILICRSIRRYTHRQSPREKYCNAPASLLSA